MPTKTVIHGSKIGTKGHPRHFKALGLEAPTKVIDVVQAARVEEPRPLSPGEQEEIHWADLRRERDRLFEETRWLIERHAEELLLGRTTTLSEDDYGNLLIYRQSLRDLLSTIVEPEKVVWPNIFLS